MTVVEDRGKVTPEETKRATYKPALSQPRGRVTPGGERGDPSGIEDKIYHRVKAPARNPTDMVWSPGAQACQVTRQLWINHTRHPKKNIKFFCCYV